MQEINTPPIDHLTWENSNPNEACFITSPERFLSNKTRGLDYLSRYSFLSEEVEGTDEMFTSNPEKFKKYEGKKILVVGAGPTTNERDWDPEAYDFIFSCNHFFLNAKLKRTKVDLCLLCNEVQLDGKDFLEYIKTNRTSIGFEDYNADANNVRRLRDLVDNDIFFCLLRFQGKIGVAPKLIVLATLLGARQVDFVGVDGPPSKNYKLGDDSNHSFQKGKPCTSNYPYELIYNHYLVLKTYLEKGIGKDVIFNNLGAGHECNVLSKI